MSKPGCICVRCNKEMLPEKNGTLVRLDATFGPYQIWSGDKVKCTVCGFEVVTGWGQNPVAEHYQEGFKEIADKCTIVVKEAK